MLAKPFVTTILLGASKMSQLDDNLGAADLELSASEVAELDRITAPPMIYPNWFHKFTLDPVIARALGIPVEAPPQQQEESKPAAD